MAIKKKIVTKVTRRGGKLYITYKGQKYVINSKVPEDDKQAQLKEVIAELKKIRQNTTKTKLKRISKPKEKRLELKTTNAPKPEATGSSATPQVNSSAESYRASNEREQRLKLEKEEKEKKDKKESISELEKKEKALILRKEKIDEDIDNITFKKETVEKLLTEVNSNYKKEQKALEEKVERLEEFKEKGTKEYKKLQKQIEDQTEELEEKKEKIENLNGEIAKYETTKNTLLEQNDRLQANIESLAKQQQALEIINENLKRENADLAKQLEEIKNEFDQIKQDKDKLIGEIETANKKIEEYNALIEQGGLEIETLTDRVNKAKDSNEKLNAQLEQKTTNLNSITEKAKQIYQKAIELSEQVAQKTASLDVLKKEFDDLDQKYILNGVKTLKGSFLKQLFELIFPDIGTSNFTNETYITHIITAGESEENQKIIRRFLKKHIKIVDKVSEELDKPNPTVVEVEQGYKKYSKKVDKEIEAEDQQTEQASSSIKKEPEDFDIDELLGEKKPVQSKGRMTSPGGLYNVEIDEYMKELEPKGFKGTYSVDEITKINPQGDSFSFVMNTEPSNISHGHWVSVFVTPHTIEYYDPFGDDPKPDFINYMMKLIRRWKPENVYQMKINSVKHQRNNSYNCGYFAMKFLADRYEGKTFKEATGFKTIENSIKGEKDVNAFKDKLKDFGYVKLKAGSGWLANAYAWLTGTYPGERPIKKLLQAHGEATITSATVYRAPIQSAIMAGANLLTAGKLKEAQSKLSYDKLFHLSIFITLSDGYRFRLEKNQSIEITPREIYSGKAESVAVPKASNSDVTIADALEKTKKKMGEKDFYQYEAFRNNCQTFISDFLKANGWMNSQLDKFINQDTDAIKEYLPGYSESVVNTLTDIAGGIQLLVGGQKMSS